METLPSGATRNSARSTTKKDSILKLTYKPTVLKSPISNRYEVSITTAHQHVINSFEAEAEARQYAQSIETALEGRRDAIDQWRSDGKSEVYITTRLMEGLRSDGVIPAVEAAVDGARVDESVNWKYGKGVATGRVVRRYTKSIELTLQGAKIKRNGSKDDPALLIEQENGARVLKLSSEVR